MSYMSDDERQAREFVDAMDALRRDFAEHCIEDKVILVSRCSMSQDTIGESNERSLERYSGLPVKTGWRPHVYETWVNLDDITDVETAELVHDTLTTLRDYAIYSDSDYSELEYERLQEYVREHLPGELCDELDLPDGCESHVFDWLMGLDENDLLDYWDGSVDDCPISAEKIVADHRASIIATVKFVTMCDSLT